MFNAQYSMATLIENYILPFTLNTGICANMRDFFKCQKFRTNSLTSNPKFLENKRGTTYNPVTPSL